MPLQIAMNSELVQPRILGFDHAISFAHPGVRKLAGNGKQGVCIVILTQLNHLSEFFARNR